MAGKAKSETEKRATRMAGYPTWFWDALNKLRQGQQEIRVRQLDSNAAISTRHRWHYFRRDLAAERHPDTEVAANTLLRVEENTLVIMNTSQIGLEVMETVRADKSPEPVFQGTSAASIPIERQGEGIKGDAAEDLVKQYLGTGGQSQSTNLCPPHELDVLEVQCLHCGKPSDICKAEDEAHSKEPSK